MKEVLSIQLLNNREAIVKLFLGALCFLRHEAEYWLYTGESSGLVFSTF